MTNLRNKYDHNSFILSRESFMLLLFLSCAHDLAFSNKHSLVCTPLVGDQNCCLILLDLTCHMNYDCHMFVSHKPLCTILSLIIVPPKNPPPPPTPYSCLMFCTINIKGLYPISKNIEYFIG